MSQKSLINFLELSYSPISNYAFTYLKHEAVFQNLLLDSNIYVISQRDELYFDQVTPLQENSCVDFIIRQNNNPYHLECSLPIIQERISLNTEDDVILEMGYIKGANSPGFSANHVDSLKFYRSVVSDPSFLIWFSPEKLLTNIWKNEVLCSVSGDIRKFLNYKVHYVGKSTDQNIWDRLTGHSTLQDILSLEYPLNHGSLPTHEIAILFFSFQDNVAITSYACDDPIDDMVDSFMVDMLPQPSQISLDAEKALVKAMQPKYNNVRFKNYPKSRDGLYSRNYDGISYTIIDPITLQYDEGKIEGGLTPTGGDIISVRDNKIFEIHKISSSTK